MKLILKLVEEHGYPLDVAEQTVGRLLDRIEQRNQKDQSAIAWTMKKVAGLLSISE